MSKRTFLFFMVLGIVGLIQAQAADLFFSEYVEGSSNNKALEIFNGTGVAVDLSQYSVKLGSNGGVWTTTNSITLSGTLANNDVYVIANAGANASILANADITSTVTYFNGDDALGLFHGETFIDAIGSYLTDPGTSWDVAGTVGATLNHTLIRKPTITQGNLNWTPSAGTNQDDSEWIIHPQDFIDNIGAHTFNPNGGLQAATPTFDPPAGVYNYPVNLVLTTTTPEATIYYTIDGTDPSNQSTVYTSAIPLNDNTTIKAIAYAPTYEPSYIAVGVYQFPIVVSNIGQLRAQAADGITIYRLDGQAVLTFQQNFRHQKYIQDSSGAILIDDFNGVITSTYNVMDGIEGITGTLIRYTTNMLQFIPVADPGPAISNSNNLAIPTLSIAQIIDNPEQHQSKLVRINDVHFGTTGAFASGQIYDLIDSADTIIFRSSFSDSDYIADAMAIPTGSIDINVIVSISNSIVQVTSRFASDFFVLRPAYAVSPENSASAIDTNTILQWTPNGASPTGYRINFGTNFPPDNMANNLDLGYVTSYNPPGSLTNASMYYWQVIPYNDYGSASDCPIWSFTSYGDFWIEEFYQFTATTGTYTPLSGTAVTDILSDDAISAAIPIGFTFAYGDNAYTEVKISSNGWIGLGTTQTGSNLTNALNSTTVVPVVAPLWDDTSMSAGTVQYLHSGTAPNRIFTIQYANLKWNYGATNQFNFQVRFYESGKIDFIYGSATGAPANASASIGINMLPGGAGSFYSVSPGVPATASTNVANTSIAVFPPQGTIYEFNPVIAPANDLSVQALTGSTSPTVGISSPYVITVRNRGTATQSVYQVKLLNGSNVELGSIAGTTIAANTNVDFTIYWTPPVAGPTTLIGKVILAGDQNTSNDYRAPLAVTVQPVGVQAVTVGNGGSTGFMPLAMWYRNSLFETVYQSSELCIRGLLTGIQFYNNFVTNLPNMPTNIWFGETTQTDLSSGWIPSTQLTQVFNSTVNYPSGANNILINLNPPYVYGGGNLVVMVERPIDTDSGLPSDKFVTQTVGSTRTRNSFTDGTDLNPAAPPTTTPTGMFPMTTFMFVPEDMGALTGNVTVSGTPLADASVSIVSSPAVQTTNSAGQYNFPYVIEGAQLVTATKHGYTSVTNNVTIVEDQITTSDFALALLPQVTVSGIVVGSDQPTVGLVGATITLMGFEPYTATTMSEGVFTISNVFAEQQYSIQITCRGYLAYSGQVSIDNLDVGLGIIMLDISVLSSNVVNASIVQNLVYLDWYETTSPGGLTQEPDQTNYDRSYIGYKVWRLMAGEEGNEASWVELTAEPIQQNYFTDNDWQDCSINLDYLWAVRKCYSGGIVTMPSLSNPLSKPYQAPIVVQDIGNVTLTMNIQSILPPLNTVFTSSAPSLEYSMEANPYFTWQLNPDSSITIVPQTDWYGVEYINILSTDPIGQYCRITVRVTVLQTWTATENFDHEGSIPVNWTTAHSGSTTYLWQTNLVTGSDYLMNTRASLGNTANERLISTAYNLANKSEVRISFDTSFLPYGNGTGTFAYSINGVTYTTIETYSTVCAGTKTYTLSVLDNQPSVKFRWTYLSLQANVGEDNYWKLDNFNIFCVEDDVVAPSPVTGFNVTSLTANSASLGWNSGSDTYFDRYEVYVSTDNTVDTDDMLWSIANDQDLDNISHTQTTITGLNLLEYWVAIRVLDQSGNSSALSDPLSFILEASPPLILNPNPTNQPSPEWSDTRNVSIGATITDDHSIDLNSLKYRFDRNANGNYDLDEFWQNVSSEAITRSLRNTVSFNLPVSSLVDGLCRFEFTVMDGYGNRTYSGFNTEQGINDDWIVRIDTTAPTAMTGFFVQEILDNSIQLIWSASSDVNFSGYRIYYSQTSDVSTDDEVWDYTDDPLLENPGTGFVTTTISGLSPATRYYFLLQALDESGRITQYPSTITAITSSSAPPQTPQNLILSVIGLQAVLDWDDVTLDTMGNPLSAVSYNVYVGDVPDFECNNDSILASTELSTVTLDEIIEYVDHLFFKVTAISGSIRNKNPGMRRSR